MVLWPCCPGCPEIVIIHGCSVLVVLSQLPCLCCHVLAVLPSISYSGCADLTILSCSPVLAVLSSLFCLTFLYLLLRSDHSLALLSFFGGPVSQALSWMSFLGRPALTVLSWLSLAGHTWLSWSFIDVFKSWWAFWKLTLSTVSCINNTLFFFKKDNWQDSCD
jgi:hypothetical protein